VLGDVRSGATVVNAEDVGGERDLISALALCKAVIRPSLDGNGKGSVAAAFACRTGAAKLRAALRHLKAEQLHDLVDGDALFEVGEVDVGGHGNLLSMY